MSEYVKKRMSAWLLKNTGWRVVFNSSIVPNWRDGRISLRDVTVECGDVNMDDAAIPEYACPVPLHENYTRFSLQLDRLDVRISLRRFLEGRGWIEEAVVEGARGTVDKRWVRPLAEWRWESRPGDFDLDALHLRDVHLSVRQPTGYRSYTVTVLAAHVPRLRAGWLFYDLLAVDSAHGIFDGRSLFTIHTPHEETGDSRRLRHFRMLGLDVRHLAQDDGALAWVTRGTVDIEGFLQLPKGDVKRREPTEDPLTAMLAPDSLKERLLLPLLRAGMGDGERPDAESVDRPLRSWYDARIRPRMETLLSAETVALADRLMAFPERLLHRTHLP